VFDRKKYMAAWHAANRDKERTRQRKWYLANREAVLARTGAYQKANPERTRAYARKHIAKDPAKHAAKTKVWRDTNPSASLAQVALRRARMKAAACNCCAPVSFRLIYEQARSLRMHVDHVRPLAKGGKHCLRNLQLLEPHSNRVKNAKWPPSEDPL
jgi:hypothetical protein